MSIAAMLLDLHAGRLESRDVLDALEPDVRDVLRAVIAHRTMDAGEFIIAALEEFALRAADAAWNEALARLPSDAHPHATLLGEILREAARNLEREAALPPPDRAD